MDKQRKYFKGTFHHLYNRGANKGNIFFDKDSYYHFLRLMKKYSAKYQINILAYSLMNNHFHLFVNQTKDNLTITEFIKSVLISYVKAINKKYERSGTLFESKTKSKIIEDESYFLWVIKYILENPVKAKIVNRIEDYEFSNARDILGLRNGTIFNRELVESYFQSESSMIEFLQNNEMPYEF